MNLPPPPPNFHPLDRTRPIEIYRRNLPHWRQKGATYFITAHTRDSLPEAALDQLRRTRTNWLRRNPPPHSEKLLLQLSRLIGKRTEEFLHQGAGSCPFHHLEYRRLLHQALLHFHGTEKDKNKRVEIGAFVIMPNHFHVVARPLHECKLEDWSGSVKQFVSRRAPEMFKVDGFLWAKESHDRIVRDLSHLNNAVRYIGRNPSMAGLHGRGTETLWLNPDWEALGWSLGAGVV